MAQAASAQTPVTWTVTGVTDSTTSPGTCNSSTHKCTTLRAAIDTAHKGDTISLAGLTGAIALAGTLPTMFYGVTIQGPGANLLTISGQDQHGIFSIPLYPQGSSTISKLTLAGALGGAIVDYSGKNLSIDECAFVDNSNTSGDGGAIEAGTVIVTNSTFSGNSASGDGGAIQGETVSVTNSTFSVNSAGRSGGAIYSGALTVTNSTFSGNSATELGGAIHTAALMAGNNIFSGNLAGGNGGAIFISLGAPSPTESYNLFYENAGGDANFTLDSTDLSSSTSGKKVNLNPMLLPLGYYGGPTETMMPEPGSSAICAGDGADLASALTAANSIDSSISTTADQRGFPIAPVEGACAKDGVDIGSVQTNYLLVTKTGDDANMPGTLPYVVSVADGQNYTDIGFSLKASLATIDLCPSGSCTGTTALTLSQGDTVIIGPPGAVTISGGPGGSTDAQILSISGSSTSVNLYGLTLGNGSSFLGGAIYSNGGDLHVDACTFSGNGAVYGGAIANGGRLTVTGSTFLGNEGLLGGAIASGGALTVTASMFYDNSVGVDGGAINSNGGTLSAVDDIFEDNFADGYGGGIYASSTPTEEDYDLFYNNTGGDTYFNGSAGSYGDHDVHGTSANPELAPLGNYGGPTQTMLPLPGSAAICAGTPDVPNLTSVDQRGFPRLNTTYIGFSASSPCVDIGAVQTNYQSIQFTNAPAGGYVSVTNGDVTPAPNVSVTENGQNIGGVPVTLMLKDFTGAGSASGVGPVTTVAGQGATFDSLTVSTTGSGTLSSTLDITPSISIHTSSTPTLKVETADKAVVSYLNALYSEGVLNHGQYNSLDTEISQAIELAGGGDYSGAINNVNDFISEVNDLYSSGVLTQQEANGLLAYANDLKTAYESQL